MALIKCQECGNNVSDKATTCPHCGYILLDTFTNEPQKVEVTGVKMSTKTRKKVIVSAVMIIAIILISIFIILQIKKENAKSLANQYKENIQTVSTKMLNSASDCEDIIILTLKVWSNSIYKTSDRETNKFTIKTSKYNSYKTSYNDDDFVDDFNTALFNLSLDTDYLESSLEIQSKTEEIQNIMKKLQNPPDEYSKIYDTVTELYGVYNGIVDLAINPSGSYTSYSSNKSEKISNFKTVYDKLKAQMPDYDY